MLNKRTKSTESFTEALNAAVATTLQTTLESILKTDCKKLGGNGREDTDYELTARMMKSQARVALDLISNIQKSEE